MQWFVSLLVPLIVGHLVYVYRLDKKVDDLYYRIASMQRSILDALARRS